MTCLICNQPLVLGSYRLVAIQRDGEAWLSRYACRGACAEQALGLGAQRGERAASPHAAPDALPVPAAPASTPLPSFEPSPPEAIS